MPLWKDLSNIQASNLPWLVAGDFNIARFTSENVSRKALPFPKLGHFNDCIFAGSLSDLRSIGGIWSWNNTNLDTRRIAGRLDMCLCSIEWLETLPYSYYVHLPH